MKTGICPQCGKEYSYYPSAPKTYCSRACQKAAARVTTTCPHCGKEFWYHKSWPRKYCSIKCSAAVNAIANLGRYTEGDPPVEVACNQCGKLFYKVAAEYKKTKNHFCSQRCFGDYLAITQKGIPRPEVAGERPDLQRRVDLVCPMCKRTFRVKQSHGHKRRFCTKSCHAKWQSISGEFSGPNNINFKGGHLPYYGPNWRLQRRKARARDNHTCQRCGITKTELGRELDVHHIIPFRTFGVDRYQEANQLDNLISLCNVCHLITEHATNR